MRDAFKALSFVNAQCSYLTSNKKGVFTLDFMYIHTKFYIQLRKVDTAIHEYIMYINLQRFGNTNDCIYILTPPPSRWLVVLFPSPYNSPLPVFKLSIHLVFHRYDKRNWPSGSVRSLNSKNALLLNRNQKLQSKSTYLYTQSQTSVVGVLHNTTTVIAIGFTYSSNFHFINHRWSFLWNSRQLLRFILTDDAGIYVKLPNIQWCFKLAQKHV